MAVGPGGVGGDGGPAIAAPLSPTGVAVDGLGNLFIAEFDDHRIRKVDGTGIITTVAGTGSSGFSGDGTSATGARLRRPLDVAVDGFGNLFIADSLNHRIRMVDTPGIIMTVAGNGLGDFSGDGGSATSAAFASPLGVAVDGAGRLFIADLSNVRIRRVLFEPAALIDKIIDSVIELNLQREISGSLDSKLDAAENALDDLNADNDAAAINSLQAFIHSVEAQRGSVIPEADADALIAAAQAIIDLLLAS